MSDPKDRPRFKTKEEAIAYSEGPWAGIYSVHHILINPEGDYSVMCHINCEFCDYCYAANEDTSLHINEAKYRTCGPHQYKENPYERHDAIENEIIAEQEEHHAHKD
jgi:hypothetical protein